MSAALEKGDRLLAAAATAGEPAALRSGGSIRGEQLLAAANRRVERALQDLKGAWADAGESKGMAAGGARAESLDKAPLATAATVAALAPSTSVLAASVAGALAAAPVAAIDGAKSASLSRAVVVICYNRPEYLQRTLMAVLDRLPATNRPHVYVSQDGSIPAVSAVIESLASQFALR